MTKKSAKIVATIGPASRGTDLIEGLSKSGVDDFRLNFSHGSHRDHKQSYDNIRSIEKKSGQPTCILADIQGPKLRLGVFKDGFISFQPGHQIELVLEVIEGNEQRISLPHPEIFASLEVGALLLLDDGKVRLRVMSFDHQRALCEVEAGTRLSDRKGVNIPNLVLPISALTEKDLDDLDFALKLGVDWVALSFVQQPSDVVEARRIIGERANILVKMEKPSALDHLDDLVTLSDGMMVARGDLGVELPPEQVPPAQRKIIRACRRAGKPVIVATQMLESMIVEAVPTRAEASDVATAVFDGADAVMLSAESAAGRYPLRAVDMMASIISQTEKSAHYWQLLRAGVDMDDLNARQSPISAAARVVARQTEARAIVTHTRSGRTAQRASRERPEAPIVCITPSLETARRVRLSWGVYPIKVGPLDTEADLVAASEAAMAELGLAENGDEIVITAGLPFGRAGRTNMLRLARLGEK